MNQLITYCGLLLALLLIAGCKQEVEEPLDDSIYGYEYYPLETGLVRTYQVDSIQFDVNGGGLPVMDSVRFYLREEIVESFEDENGEVQFRIERYRSEHPDGPWLINDVTVESRSQNQGYRQEGNLRFINLVFPIKDGIEWDGNAFLEEGLELVVHGEVIEFFKDWDYRILSVDQSETVGDQAYEQVVTVQQADSDNVIERRYSVEKYAKGIGLIYREREILDSYCKYQGENEPCIDKTWREKAGRGLITRETLIDTP